jgi:hypothetical protein
MVIGGYGIEGQDSEEIRPENSSQQSTRKLSNLFYTSSNPPISFNLKKNESERESENDLSMHADSVTFEINGVSLLIVSGGRTSPSQALPCLRVFKSNIEAKDKDINDKKNGNSSSGNAISDGKNLELLM